MGWTFHPTPKRPPFTYTFRFVHVGWCHRRNHPCQVSSQSVQQFRLPRGSKFTISHRLREWLLQQCYALTCYTVTTARGRNLSCIANHLQPAIVYLCVLSVCAVSLYCVYCLCTVCVYCMYCLCLLCVLSVYCVQDEDSVDYSLIEPSADAAAAPRGLSVFSIFSVMFLSAHQSLISLITVLYIQ